MPNSLGLLFVDRNLPQIYVQPLDTVSQGTRYTFGVTQHTLSAAFKQSTDKQVSMFHRAFFNSIIDKHQHMHFFTFKTVLV